MTATFITGHVIEKLRELPADSVHMAVTSPPYYGLRKYSGEQEVVWGGDLECEHEWVTHYQSPKGGRNLPNNMPNTGGDRTQQLVDSPRFGVLSNYCSLCGAWKGDYGAEPSPEVYVSHSVEILREVRRVLRPDGVVFWNIKDSYASGKGTCFNPGGGNNSLEGHARLKEQGVYPLDRGNKSVLEEQGLKPKDLCLIPQRLAIALCDDGWWVRSIVLWNKRNPMPSSIKGWRWERHMVPQCPNCESYSSFKGRVCKVCGWTKPSNRGETKAWRAETGQQERSDDGGFKSDSFMVECPGCPKCSPNDGYVLRKGSWRPTESHEYILMLAKSANYFGDGEAVKEPHTTKNLEYEMAKSSKGGHKKKMTCKPNVDKYLEDTHSYSPGGRNLRSVWDDDDPFMFWQFLNKHLPEDQLDELVAQYQEYASQLKDVWTFSTEPYKGGHYAAFPPRLAEICIKSGTSEKGVCSKCGSPWVRVLKKGFTAHDGDTATDYAQGTNANRLAPLRQAARQRGGEYGSTASPYATKYVDDALGPTPQGCQRNKTIEEERVQSRRDAVLLFPGDERAQQDCMNSVHDHGGLTASRTIGWKPSCVCLDTDIPVPSTVLDLFSGVGTTAMVCERLGHCNSINIDISADYHDLARERLAKDESRRIEQFIKKAKQTARANANTNSRADDGKGGVPMKK